MKELTYKGVTYSCPFTHHFRRHTPEERQRMEDSITKRGFRNSVIVYRDTDEEVDNCILDGEGRLTIAAELGEALAYTVPFEDYGDLTTEEAYTLAMDCNDERRHETAEAIRKRREERVAKAAELRKAGESVRSIADQTGVSVGQVQRDLETASTVSGDTVEPESGKVKGKDGKERPAKRASRKRDAAPAASETPSQTEAPASPSPASPPSPPPVPVEEQPVLEHPRDRWDRIIPRHLRTLFAEAQTNVRSIAGNCSAAAKRMTEFGAASPDVGRPLRRRPDLPNELRRIANYCRQHVLPYCICPLCGGSVQPQPCTTCSGRGWLYQSDWARLPPEHKREARSHARGEAWEGDEPEAVEGASEEAPVERVHPGEGVDFVGFPIPKGLADDFEPEWLLEIVETLERIGRRMQAEKHLLKHLPPKFHTSLESCVMYIRQDTLPYAVCRRCGGSRKDPLLEAWCQSCVATGYHPESSQTAGFNQPPADVPAPAKGKGKDKGVA